VSPRDFQRAFQRAQTAVVAVEATGERGVRRATGFVAGPGGLVACARQTVEGARVVRVLAAGAWHVATPVDLDGGGRLALLRTTPPVEVHPLAAERNGSLEVGRWVVAVEWRGDRPVPVAGTVSWEGLPARLPGDTPVVLVDAPANPGSPLLNLRGELVGVSLGRVGKRRARATALAHLQAALARGGAVR
jgi:S1-C subfamily serine protease